MDSKIDINYATKMRGAQSAGGRFRRSLAAMSAPYQPGRKWHLEREDAISFPPARSKKGTKGPRSMVAMCLRVLADNISAAPDCSIGCLPEKLRWALWKELSPRNVSLHVWNIVGYGLQEDCYRRATGIRYKRKEYGDKEVTMSMAMHRFRQEIIDPPCSLSTYIDPLANLQECLVYLCLDNIASLERREMLSLAQLPRLAVLELIEHEPMSSGINDRLISGWRQFAETTNPVTGLTLTTAFGSLRVLRILSERHGVSPRSLDHLLKFPELEIFDITALANMWWLDASELEVAPEWRVTEPRGSPLVSYAEAYLDGFVDVNMQSVEGLSTVFDDDGYRLALVDDPRALLAMQYELQRSEEEETNRDRPYLRKYLDEGWQAVLQGKHPLSTSVDTRGADGVPRRQDMTDDQVFWFLSLLDQKECNPDYSCFQTQAAGVTIVPDRFVSLRLRSPPKTAGQHRRLLNSRRLIFSRCRGESETKSVTDPASRSKRKESTAENGTKIHRNPVPSWSPHVDDRRETNLRPRIKRQKTMAELLSSMGVPGG